MAVLFEVYISLTSSTFNRNAIQKIFYFGLHPVKCTFWFSPLEYV
jgi:hypothetical protein